MSGIWSAGITAAGMLGSAAITTYGGGGGGGGGGGYGIIDAHLLPEEFEVSDIYTESQDYLKNLGFDILGGDVPDYYKPIGETGGKEFEDVLGAGVRDISAATAGSLVTGGRGRGGAVQTATAKAVGDYTRNLRFQDWERSLKGKQGLLTTGVGITENARTSAANLDIAKSNYDINRFAAINRIGVQNNQLIQSQNATNAGMWGEMASQGVGAIGSAYDIYQQNKNTAQSQMPRQVGITQVNPAVIAGTGYSGYRNFSPIAGGA